MPYLVMPTTKNMQAKNDHNKLKISKSKEIFVIVDIIIIITIIFIILLLSLFFNEI